MCKMYIVENLRYINCYIYGDVIMIKGGGGNILFFR